jgi:hypothetical protein
MQAARLASPCMPCAARAVGLSQRRGPTRRRVRTVPGIFFQESGQRPPGSISRPAHLSSPGQHNMPRSQEPVAVEKTVNN